MRLDPDPARRAVRRKPEVAVDLVEVARLRGEGLSMWEVGRRLDVGQLRLTTLMRAAGMPTGRPLRNPAGSGKTKSEPLIDRVLPRHVAGLSDDALASARRMRAAGRTEESIARGLGVPVARVRSAVWGMGSLA